MNEQAFGRIQEADLGDRLREGCPGLVSPVAVAGAEIAGHILFSHAVIEGKDRTLNDMGLAPVAVLPAFQR